MDKDNIIAKKFDNEIKIFFVSKILLKSETL